MNLIVVVDKNWGIGKNNDLLFRLKEDMSYFREKTLHKVIVMGSNTLLSFPGSKPLPHRTNVVLYPGGKREDCIIAQSIEELKEILQSYDSADIFVVGGAMFYKTMLPYCNTAYITKVDADGGATHFFENLDTADNWFLAEKGDEVQDSGHSVRFCVYKNKNPLTF